MRKAETAPSRLLLPLIPALAMALVALVPDSPSPAPVSRCLSFEPAHHAPHVAPAPVQLEPTGTAAMSF
jgi:hypothetical protein